ncbi:MAG: type II toxin-antitoxin system VapC family toxin [Planctomycetaceae bacterium]
MMDTVYVETTVVGNLAGRDHPDPLIAARQAVTRRWWATAQSRFRLLISQLMIEECAAGDPSAARERMDEIESLDSLSITDEVRDLAHDLHTHGAVPASEPRDALHIAVSAVHTIPGDVELQAHRQCGAAGENRIRLPRRRLRAARDLHAGRTC